MIRYVIKELPQTRFTSVERGDLKVICVIDHDTRPIYYGPVGKRDVVIPIDPESSKITMCLYWNE